MKKCYLAVIAAAGLLAGPADAALPWRTDINPALIYWQVIAILPRDEQKLIDNYQMAPMDDAYRELVNPNDSRFRLLRRAAELKQPCDWGIDMADGHETLLPHLGHTKKIIKTAAFRARYFVNHGQENEAVQDLISAFVLARRVSDDQTLIGSLVQFACESIVINSIAENFHAFSDDALKRLLAGLDAAPAGGSVSRCIGIGEHSFGAYFQRKIDEAQAAHPGDDAAVLSEIRELLARTVFEDEGGKPGNHYAEADRFIAAGGGTTAGLLAFVKGLDPLYAELQTIAALPHDQFTAANDAFFEKKITNSRNPFAKSFFPALKKARYKEFRSQARLALLRAGIQYRLKGEAGLKSVRDPFGSGPLAFRRFEFQNVDRGFELRSRFHADVVDEFPEVLIFVEKAGEPMVVSGPRAGKAFEKNP